MIYLEKNKGQIIKLIDIFTNARRVTDSYSKCDAIAAMKISGLLLGNIFKRR